MQSNRKLRNATLLVAACLALVWCVPSFGQVLKGSISGTVTDPQGAVVSGAQVKATQIETATVLTSTSDNSGSFHFNLIPAGTYKIEVSAQGFKTSVQNNVLVSAGRDSGVGLVKLSVGDASTTVEVTSDAPLIETTQSQVTNTFSGARSLPLLDFRKMKVWITSPCLFPAWSRRVTRLLEHQWRRRFLSQWTPRPQQ